MKPLAQRWVAWTTLRPVGPVSPREQRWEPQKQCTEALHSTVAFSFCIFPWRFMYKTGVGNLHSQKSHQITLACSQGALLPRSEGIFATVSFVD